MSAAEKQTLSRFAEWEADGSGGAVLNGVPLGSAETAWLCYALAHAGRPEQAEPLLAGLARRLEPALGGGPEGLLDAAHWLWAYGVCRSAGCGMAADAGLLAHAVDLLERHWRTPRPHWLAEAEGGAPAVWLSNLAIVYGGLLAVQPHAPQLRERIQALLKTMRELVFAKFIKAEKVVSRLGSADIYGDIVLSAVPFGLLGIEDRILIEALYVVERELASGQGVRLSADDTYYGGCERPDLACLLAWYYAEKGDLARAKQLIARVDQLLEQDNGMLRAVDLDTAREPLYAAYWRERDGEPPHRPLAVLLHAIAARSIAAKQSDGAGERRVQFLHEPIGTGDPYYHYAYERLPREPLAGDFVRVRTVTQPFRPDQRITLNVRVNGGPVTTERMAISRTADGEMCWEAALGRFAFGDRVDYWFECADDGSVSDVFSFRARAWLPISQPVGWSSDGRSVRLSFRPVPGAASGPSLVFDDAAGDGTLRIRFDARDAAAGGTDGTRTTGETGKTGEAEDAGEAAPFPAEGLTATFGELELAVRPDAEFAVRHRGRVLLQTYGRGGQPAVELLTDGSGRIWKVRYNFRFEEGDRVYGMGERYARLEYRGLAVDNYVYNEYRSQGMRTYLPVPFVLHSRGFGLFANTPMYTVFDFGASLSDRMQVQADLHAERSSLDLLLLPGEPLEAIRRYTDVTGKPALPPKWAFGPWMSSNNWDSQAEVARQVALTQEHGIPATVIVLEQWSDEATFYIFNDAQYEVKDGNEAFRYEDFTFPAWGRWPDPKGMVEALHASGLKVLLWQIPVHKFMYGIAHAQHDADEAAMLANGYHVRKADGEPYRIPYNWFKDSLVIDFTNEAARRWWFEKRKYLLEDLGVDGFKTDGGECIFGPDLRFADGRTGDEMRNLYPNEYIGHYYRFVQEHVPGGGITFSRAGYAGAQNYPLHWAGDERSTFEAFRSSLRAGLSSGMSGIPFWGWDLAGFHGDIPTAELYIRSAQMAAFCPVMQYHAETKGEFNQDRTPWNIAERTGKPEVIALYKKYADLRMNLLPYIYAQAIVSSREGVPMMRAMFVAYPHDPACRTLDGQYLFGDSLLVAPVVEEGQFTKNVYFPEGRWMPLFGESVAQEGNRYATVRADLGDIPVYIRENGVVPLNLDASLRLCSHVGNRVDRYERLVFCLHLTGEIDYVFEDDLGPEIRLTARKEAGEIRVSVRSVRDEPVTVWLKGVGEVRAATGGRGPLRQAGSAEDLTAGSYFLRDGDCYVHLAGQDDTVVLSI